MESVRAQRSDRHIDRQVDGYRYSQLVGKILNNFKTTNRFLN